MSEPITPSEASVSKIGYDERRQVGRRKPNYKLRQVVAVGAVAAALGVAAAHGSSNEDSSRIAADPSILAQTRTEAIQIFSETPAERMFTGSLVINLEKARVRNTAGVIEEQDYSNSMDKLTKAEQINGVEIPEGTKFIEITWPILKRDTRGRPDQDWIAMAIKYEGEKEVETGFVAYSESTRKNGIVRQEKDGVFSRIENSPNGKRITQVGDNKIIMQEQMGKVTPLAINP
ncbi:MAG: hypothetical protein V1697_02295 [Candidatus Levyibacteriota bacterium]